MRSRRKYAVGVDIGGTKTCIVIADRHANPLYERCSASCGLPDSLFPEVMDCLNAAEISADEVAAMGVGVAGRVDAERGIVLDSPALAWLNYPLLDVLRAQFAFPIFINNDVRMALVGETSRCVGIKDMAFVSIGTGLGCSFLSGGHIVSGADNSAGEIGYLLTEQDLLQGNQNKCNAFGAAEAHVSGSALSRQAQQFNMDASQLFSAYGADSRADDIVDHFLEKLGLVLANMVSVINPEVVVLGGGVSDSLHPFLQRINEIVAGLTPIRTKVQISSLGNRAGAVGASIYGIQCADKEVIE